MNAAELAVRWNLSRNGRDWRGECPACGYADSFVLSQGRGDRAIGWCASCQDGAAIAAAIRATKGGWQASPPAPPAGNCEADRARRRERAIALWNGADPVPGTIAETYLHARRTGHVATSPALRFRGDTPHPNGGRLPALLARIDGPAGDMIAMHRTFLRRDGSAKADLDPPKASLGGFAGGAIRLDPIGAELVIGEGIESSASAGRFLGLPAWAAVSAGNLARFLVLPPEVTTVLIAADADQAGERAAREAAVRWQREGRRVRIARPNRPGADFNDLLREREAEIPRA